MWAWVAQGAAGFDEMTNVPAGLRTALAEHVPFSTLEIEAESRARDGTVKTLFLTAGGQPVEAQPMEGRRQPRLGDIRAVGQPAVCDEGVVPMLRHGDAKP